MRRPVPIKRAFSKLLIQIPILLSVHSVPPSVLIRCQYPEAAENFETRGSSSSTEQYAYPCSDFPKCPLHCSLAQATEPVCNLHRGPARGGGGVMLPIWILKHLVSVFIDACRLLSALPSLSQFGRGRLSLVAISFYALSLLFGPCRLSEFTLAGPLHSV